MVCRLRGGSFNIENKQTMQLLKINLYSFLDDIYNFGLKGLTIDELSFEVFDDTLVIKVADKEEVIDLNIIYSYSFEFDKKEGIISFYFSDKNEKTTFVIQFIIKDRVDSNKAEVFVKKFVC